MKFDTSENIVWIPKTVIFEGKEYPAPLNVLPLLTGRLLIEMLEERKKDRDRCCKIKKI
jgi:hypothetical protein